jgi:hypothetical protein
MVGTDEKGDLAERVARGGYVVDPEAVAEAIIRRWQSGWSLMLVPGEAVDREPIRADEDESVAGVDLA